MNRAGFVILAVVVALVMTSGCIGSKKINYSVATQKTTKQTTVAAKKINKSVVARMIFDKFLANYGNFNGNISFKVTSLTGSYILNNTYSRNKLIANVKNEIGTENATIYCNPYKKVCIIENYIKPENKSIRVNISYAKSIEYFFPVKYLTSSTKNSRIELVKNGSKYAVIRISNFELGKQKIKEMKYVILNLTRDGYISKIVYVFNNSPNVSYIKY